MQGVGTRWLDRLIDFAGGLFEVIALWWPLPVILTFYVVMMKQIPYPW